MKENECSRICSVISIISAVLPKWLTTSIGMGVSLKL